jgi:flagellar hook-basal body complex protein FliE
MPAPLEGQATTGESQFGRLLIDALSETNAAQNLAQTQIEDRLTGGDVTQVEALTSLKKADLALRTMLQVRNKLMDAYREIVNLRM